MSPAGRAAKRRPAAPPRRRSASGPDGEALLARAERVVEQARSRGVAQAECYMAWGESLDVEIEKGAIANTGSGQGGGGGLRVVVDGRVGFAYFTDAAHAPEAVQQAVAASRHAEPLGFQLPAAARPGRLPRWDPDVAALDPDEAIRLAEEMLRAARSEAPKATLAGGGVGLEVSVRAIASSEGVSVWDGSTDASVGASLVQEDRGRSVSASQSQASHTLRIDAAAVVAHAGETVRSLLRPAKAKGGRAHVLFRPEAGAELVSDLVLSACMGDEARRGKTVWSGRLGEHVAARRLSVSDDSRVPGAVGGVPFDDEGMPTRRLAILENGVLRNFIYDAWDAHRHKARTTRSAVRGDFKSRPHAGTHHVVIAGTGARPVERLVAGMDHGFVVESVLGAHTANATTGDFSVTAPNVWRVEGGAIVGPCKEIAIGGNLPRLLGRLEGTSKEAKQMDGLRVPHLLFADVDVSV